MSKNRQAIRDLIGDDDDLPETPAPEPRRIRRPELAIKDIRPKRQIHDLSDEETFDRHSTQDLNEIRDGVTVTWLATLYGIARKTVEKQLVGCPVLKRGKNGAPLYDLTIAAGYMSSRKRDIAAALKTAKEADLPAPLQRQFWQTKLLRNKWEMEAGEMWATDDVMDVLGEIFKIIKNSTMLWVDNLEQVAVLTKEQRLTLISYVDEMNNKIHSEIKKMPDRRQTVSFRDVELEAISKIGSEFDPVASDDEDDDG